MTNTNENKKDVIPSYKMSEEEKINITNQLKDAIEMNKICPQKDEWNSKKYRAKYYI